MCEYFPYITKSIFLQANISLRVYLVNKLGRLRSRSIFITAMSFEERSEKFSDSKTFLLYKTSY